MPPLPSWPGFVARVVLDFAAERTGIVPRRIADPGRFFSGFQLGLRCRHNGSDAYAVWHRGFFDPRTYFDAGPGAACWFRTDELPRFNREVLPRLRHPVVIVNAESDWTVPGDLPAEAETLVASGKVRRWFAANYDHRQFAELVTPLPLGVKYGLRRTLERSGPRRRDGWRRDDAPPIAEQDRIWAGVAAAAPPVSRRRLLAFGDFWLNNSSRARRFGESRADIHAVLRDNPAVVFPPAPLPKPDLLRAYSGHAFVLSPHGRGLDCYRTWEALLCGAIVIVKRSPLDPLYRGLPVVIVDDWREITPAALAAWAGRYGDSFDRTRLHQVLSADYWWEEICRAAGPA